MPANPPQQTNRHSFALAKDGNCASCGKDLESHIIWTTPQQTNELDASDGGSPEQQFESLVRATITEARLFKNADKVKLEEEIINLHKALITKQVGEARIEELERVKKQLRDDNSYGPHGFWGWLTKRIKRLQNE